MAAIHAGRRMFSLSPAAMKLLDTAVLVDELEQSAIVERLIMQHLAGYYSGRKGSDLGLPGDVAGS